MEEINTILITKDYWMNSPLKIARFYGGTRINNKAYLIVGEKEDLVFKKWIPFYNSLGRDRFMELLSKNMPFDEAKKYVNDLLRKEKESKNQKVKESLDLFCK